ncbi:MAG: hypothetical protein ACKPKO_46295, partial [Candidatus Fonsibacter sp.]
HGSLSCCKKTFRCFYSVGSVWEDDSHSGRRGDDLIAAKGRFAQCAEHTLAGKHDIIAITTAPR